MNGLAGWSHDRGGVAATLNSGGNDGGFRTEPGEHLVAETLREHPRPGSNSLGQLTFVKTHRAASTEDAEGWAGDDTAPTPNDFDTGDSRAVALAVGASGMIDDPLLPLGLDSHRYRCCGNGVVADVGEWIGRRLLSEIA